MATFGDFTVTRLEHPGCPDCLNLADQARHDAAATGSLGATRQDEGPGGLLLHAATVERGDLTPAERPDPVRAAAVTLGVEVINGYVIMAERRVASGRRVILAARRALNGFDYVTAVARPAAERPRSWDFGHYFDHYGSGRQQDALELAVRDFDNR